MQLFRNIYRGGSIIFMLARNDSLFFLEKTPLVLLGKFLSYATLPFRNHEIAKLSNGQKLCSSFQNLGPCFIKLGQALSIRADIVGEDIAGELTKLQDKLPFFAYSEVKRIIEKEFKKPLEQVFTEFSETPVAAASIAQVHFAKTKEGREVAVKILRPNIYHDFLQDVDLLLFVSKIAEKISPIARRVKFHQIVKNFRTSSVIEMDLLYEAASASELAENFKEDNDIKVPAVFWEYSTSKILTIEKFEGTRIDNIEGLQGQGLDVNEILKRSSRIFVKQVLRDGFFHADMHPGNVLVDKAGRICVFDFGIMGRLDKKTRIFLAEMMLGFLNRDYKKVADLHFDYGFVPAHQDKDLFAQACRVIAEPILNQPQNKISVARLLEKLLKMAETFEMNTDPKLFLLQKTMMMAEGVGRMLNPEVNFWELSRELIQDWGGENLGLKARIKDRLEEIVEIIDNIRKILKNLAEDKTANRT